MLFDALGSGAKIASERSKRLVDALAALPGRERSGQPSKAGDWFRTSSLPRLCPRELALSKLHGIAPGEPVSVHLQWTFAIGSAFHDALQREFLPKLGDVFQGYWRCQRCKRLHMRGMVLDAASSEKPPTGQGLWIPRPKWCGCGPDAEFDYVEMTLVDHDLRLSGHCDGILAWPDGVTEVLEIKSIDARGFEAVDPWIGGSAKEANVEQVHPYMWMAGLNRARLVYVRKGDGQKIGPEEIIEHEIQFDDGLASRLRERMRLAIQAVDVDGFMPERLEACTKKSAGRAKACPLRHQCFGG